MYAASRHDAYPSLVGPRADRSTPARFTPLEERVIRLAASGSERLSTTVEPLFRRAIRRVADVVMARRGGRELADPRLEALRSYAVAVRQGRSDGLAVFHAAGYSAGHAEMLKRLVSAAIAAGRQRPERRERILYVSGLSLGVASILGFVVMTGTLLAGV